MRAVHVVGRNELRESANRQASCSRSAMSPSSCAVAEEIALRRIELMHLSRVSSRSMSCRLHSIGHEINQPLQSILSNAQAALLFLARESPDLDEIREILRDIVLDSRRVPVKSRENCAHFSEAKTRSPFESLDLQ